MQGNRLEPTGWFFFFSLHGTLVPLIHDASLEKKSNLVTDWSDGTAKLFLGLLRSGAKVHEPKLEKEPPGRGVQKADPRHLGDRRKSPQALGSCSWETGLCL